MTVSTSHCLSGRSTDDYLFSSDEFIMLTPSIAQPDGFFKGFSKKNSVILHKKQLDYKAVFTKTS